MDASQTTIEHDDPPRFYEALGRVLAVMRDCHALSGALGLDWWSANDAWQIEWRAGPFPAEVATVVLQAAGDDDHAGRAVRGQIEPGPAVVSSHYAYLRVLGVLVALRAVDPIGVEEVLRRQRAQLLTMEGLLTAARQETRGD